MCFLKKIHKYPIYPIYPFYTILGPPIDGLGEQRGLWAVTGPPPLPPPTQTIQKPVSGPEEQHCRLDTHQADDTDEYPGVGPPAEDDPVGDDAPHHSTDEPAHDGDPRHVRPDLLSATTHRLVVHLGVVCPHVTS